MQQPNNFLQFNNGKDFFAFTVGNTTAAPAKVILFPSYNPSDPGKVVRSGNVPAFNGGGQLATISFSNGGGFGSGTNNNVSPPGGTGTGAKVNITVTAGDVTAVVISDPGQGYLTGDILTVAPAAFFGAGYNGFFITVVAASPATNVSGASGMEKSIDEFLSYIDKYATECTALQIATDNNLQLHQMLNIIPKEPYKNLENKIIPLSKYANENAPNQNVININDQIIPLDNLTEINITVPPATSTTFTFVCRPAS